MDDALLFLHVLSAFVLMGAVVVLSSAAIGPAPGGRVVTVGDRLWDIGGLGTLLFGVWIVLREDAYDITDGWILGALVLWVVASGVAIRGRAQISEGEEPRYTPLGARLHWLRAVLVVGFLVLMIWKPGL